MIDIWHGPSVARIHVSGRQWAAAAPLPFTSTTHSQNVCFLSPQLGAPLAWRSWLPRKERFHEKTQQRFCWIGRWDCHLAILGSLCHGTNEPVEERIIFWVDWPQSPREIKSLLHSGTPGLQPDAFSGALLKASVSNRKDNQKVKIRKGPLMIQAFEEWRFGSSH